jgi:hypothetical protein
MQNTHAKDQHKTPTMRDTNAEHQHKTPTVDPHAATDNSVTSRPGKCASDSHCSFKPKVSKPRQCQAIALRIQLQGQDSVELQVVVF